MEKLKEKEPIQKEEERAVTIQEALDEMLAEDEEEVSEESNEETQSDDNLLNNPAIIGYHSMEEQNIIYNALLNPGIDFQNDTILDVGCGLGDVYGFIQDVHGVEKPNYLGIDYNPNMVDLARKKYESIKVEHIDLFDYDRANRKDWVIGSSIFNLKMQDDMEVYLKTSIDRMYDLANKGVVFNVLSTHSTINEAEGLCFYDPSLILNYCLQKYRTAILRHDYIDGDFTIYIYK